MTPNTSIYLHIPFCKHRCAYCDFNTYANQEDSIPAYVVALINEIDTIATLVPHPINVHTVFFGGGTPSLLSVNQFASLMDALRTAFTLAADAEISIAPEIANTSTAAAPHTGPARRRPIRNT